MEKYEELENILNENSKSLVGLLLKKLEILDGNNLNFEQIKNLYKSLIKEQIYENNRFLLKLIRTNFETGKIVFRQNTPK